MQNYEVSVRYKPALVLKDPKRVITVYKAILNILSSEKNPTGSQIIKSLDKHCSKSEAEAVILNFVDRDLIEKEGGKFKFSDYVFCNPNLGAMEKDITTQVEAASLLALCEKGQEKAIEHFDLVATLPNKDKNFHSIGEVGSIYSHIQRLLSEARTSIFIVNPFFDEEGASRIIPTLVSAAKSGVNIRLVVKCGDKSEAMKLSIKNIRGAFEKNKITGKLEIRNYYKSGPKGQIYATHAKVILADSAECYMGSANITTPSLYYNFELGYVIKGDQVKDIELLLNELWDCSSKL